VFILIDNTMKVMQWSKVMIGLLKLEEIAQFGLRIFLFSQLDYDWWAFPACLLLPDLSMIGYLFGPRLGAWMYNLFHHKLLGITLYLFGATWQMPWLELTGILLFSHSAMDRIFGYGLKYADAFTNTHLGRIGK